MPFSRSPWRLPGIPLALALLALTGCTDTVAEPRPTSTRAPILETDEQALAAVTDTYERFQALSYLILAEGGVEPERIRSVASREVAEIEIEGYRQASTNGYVVSGRPAISSVELELWLPHPDPMDVIARAKVCMDISGVHVADSAGTSIVDPGREDLSQWRVDISYREVTQELVVSAKDQIEGDCN